MRMLLFARRNAKEVLRDPINLLFGLCFPLVLLLLFYVIDKNIPKEANNTMFAVQNIAPGIAMFGSVFMALFSGMLLSKDRMSSFLSRLFTSPMTASDFLLGYTLPMLVMAAVQASIAFLAALPLGLALSANILLAVFVIVPISALFVGMGLLCGSLLDDKAVGGICGALLTNLAGWLSGIWFPLDLVGGALQAVAKVLPFYHGAEATRAALSGDFGGIFSHLAVVLAYAAAVYLLAVTAFRRRMRGR